MKYQVRENSLPVGFGKRVPVFTVYDEMGHARCHEATQERALAHISELEEADRRNARE